MITRPDLLKLYADTTIPVFKEYQKGISFCENSVCVFCTLYVICRDLEYMPLVSQKEKEAFIKNNPENLL